MLKSKPIRQYPITYTFEQYLKDVHIEEDRTILDDDLPDAFEAWLVNQDLDRIIELSDNFANIWKNENKNTRTN